MAVLPLNLLVALLRERSGWARMAESDRWLRRMRSRGWAWGSLGARWCCPDGLGLLDDVVTVTLDKPDSD